MRLLRHFVEILAPGHFNPRTREGCDAGTVDSLVIRDMDFNPRTREGCDQACQNGKCYATIISIHAPVKGATVIGTDASVGR